MTEEIIDNQDENTQKVLKALEDLRVHIQSQLTEKDKQIEKMKCCANCKLSSSDEVDGTYCCEKRGYVQADCKCPNWQLKE